MNNQSNHLVLSGLSMSFAGKPAVLSDMDFAISAGSVTGLLGKNGAGKTTLMRIALGLVRPDSGDVKLFGESAWTASSAIRKRIGYVPQGDVACAWMRVKDALTLISSFYENWDDHLIQRYLNEWEVNPASYIQDLSKGQQQKVAILMAIGHQPDLLVLDEPVASLDPGARRQFLQALVELNQDMNRAILFSTHITSDLERVAADVAVLHEGKLRFQGDLDTLKEGCQRLHLQGESLPDQLQEQGIEHYRHDGGRASAFATNWNQVKTDALAKTLSATVVAETLPLEDLFLELTHG